MILTDLPPMFYLDPDIDVSTLPMKSEFECVFCPEFTTGAGWRQIRFQVVRQQAVHNKTWIRAFTQLSTQALTEEEALALYEHVYEGVMS